MRSKFSFQRKFSLQRMRRRVIAIAAVAVAASTVLPPQIAAAEGLLDFLFGGLTRPQRPAAPQANVFADPFGTNPQSAQPPRSVSAGGSAGPAFCVRSCDGRYFPLTRGGGSAAQICQSFCPASPTRVFFGSNIDGATAANGERYADSENAFAYRKALRADCTCNGRDPAGLAPIDLALDNSLRPGDVVATTDGLVAYSGPRGGSGGPSADFTPVASYPGLTAEVRARLTETKVAPVRAEMLARDVPPPEASVSAGPAMSLAPATAAARDKRVDMN